MTTVPATIVALLVLSAAGALPTLWSVGFRWVAVPLLPLTGSAVVAMAATGYLATGLTFMTWFVGLSAVLAAATGAHWWVRPGRRPWPPRSADAPPEGGRRLIFAVTGAAGLSVILAAVAWGLRALATPTVGFDARALWITRGGWFLQPHHQLVTKMTVHDVVLIQSAYPPLVSATTSVAWSVTGNHSLRLGVVVAAVLNACVLAAAAFALVEAGRRVTVRLAAARDTRMPPGAGTTGGSRTFGGIPAAGGGRRRDAGSVTAGTLLPSVVGTVAAVLVVFIAFGVTEPFMTNGYADPIWSLAGVGAIAYGLQLQEGASDTAVALILVLVAGLSKDEGVANAVPLVVLVVGRAAVARFRGQHRSHWWHPLAAGTGVLAAVAAWPLLMKAIHARGATTTFSPSGDFWSRTTATYHGMSPYLHVLVLALPIALGGGAVLSRVRRAGGLGNDLWAWAAVAGGLATVGGALVLGSGAIAPWLETTVHRVTEFDALAGWWIVAMWGVAAAAAPAMALWRSGTAPPPRPVRHRSGDPGGVRAGTASGGAAAAEGTGHP